MRHTMGRKIVLDGFSHGLWTMDYGRLSQKGRSAQRGQASLEMTVAMIGALILLFGSFKVFLWINERIIGRQMSYEATRQAAGTHGSPGIAWVEPQKRLNIFN